MPRCTPMELFRPWVLPQQCFSWDYSPAVWKSNGSAKPATHYGHARALDIVVTTYPFSLETLHEHRLFKTPVWKHIRRARLLVILTVPLIYACAIPFALLDLFVTIYQAVCFPIFRVPKVR